MPTELPDPILTGADRHRSNLPFVLFFNSLNGTHVAKGEIVTLRWHAENATAVYLRHDGREEGVPGVGSKTVSVDQVTTFQLHVENWFGNREIEITITPSL